MGGSDDGGDSLPRLLICGQPRAGKTSIMKVVFQKMSAIETRCMQPTQQIDTLNINRNSLMRFQVHDFPGMHQFDSNAIDLGLVSKASAVVFVLDVTGEPYGESLSNALRLIEYVFKNNPKVSFDIFIHKADGDYQSEDYKAEVLKDFQFKLSEQLQNPEVMISYHCTSLYDHTIFEAVSKVVQKLIPQQLPLLEQCLDSLATNSRMEKAYIFDVISKVYIASDSQPVDLQSYELCSDMIDVTIDVTWIYGNPAGPVGSSHVGNATCDASCAIHLSNGRMLYLKEVDKCLAVVCIMREENFNKPELINHNIEAFKQALVDIFGV